MSLLTSIGVIPNALNLHNLVLLGKSIGNRYVLDSESLETKESYW